VVALRVRSAARAGQALPAPGRELDYAALLNRALPADIRVLGWAPAPPGFSARFSTRHRTYRRAPASITHVLVAVLTMRRTTWHNFQPPVRVRCALACIVQLQAWPRAGALD